MFQNLSSNALIGQITFLVIIILGFIFFFRKFNQKVSIQELVLASIFTVIPVVLSAYLSFYIPLGGVNAFKIGFAQPIMAVGGVLLSSPIGYAVGFIVDLLGFILAPAGTMYFGFTFNAIAVFLIGYFVFKTTENNSDKTLRNKINFILIMIAVVFSTLILQIGKSFKLESLVIDLNQTLFLIPNRYLLMVGVWIIVGLFALISNYIVRMIKDANKGDLYRFIIVVLCIEIFVNISLTTLHLNALYSIPHLVLIVPRIIKALVFLPINVLIGYFVLKTIRNIKR